jgi:transcriptional regulator with XRE-family HTH domain
MSEDMPMRARAGRTSGDSSSPSRARARDTSGHVVGEERERLRRTFGTRLWELRAARGMTQGDVAERTGLHPRSVSALERGARRPTDVTCHRLAAVFVQASGGDDVDVAVLALALQDAAGASLRVVERRRPLRQSRVRAYELARQRRAATAMREVDTMIAAAITALNLPPDDDSDLWADNRPAVRRDR